MNYDNFDIWIDRERNGRYPVVVYPPSTTDDEYVSDDIFSSDFSNIMAEFEKNKSSREDLEKVGKHLFNSVFRGNILNKYNLAFGKVQDDPEKGLRIRLFIRAPALAVLPWELLYDKGRFLATWIKTPVVRYLPASYGNRQLTIQPPIKVLVAIPSFSGLNAIDEERIVESAFADLKRKNLVHIEFMTDRVSISTITKRLTEDGPFHIFHFIGHGCFKKEEDDGYLLVNRDATGTESDDVMVDVEDLEQLSAENFADLFQNHASMKLIVLNSCLGAKVSSTRPLAGVVPKLFSREIPAVVAMQYPILDSAAARFAAQFYSSLCKGYERGLIDVAVTNARNLMHIKGRNELSFAASVLFMRSDSGAIFDLRLDPAPAPNIPIDIGLVDQVAPPSSTSASIIPFLWHQATDAIRLVSDAPRLTALKEAREKNIEVVERLTRQARTFDEQNALFEELESEKTEFKKLEQRLSGVVSASVKISRTALTLGVILFLASTFGLFNIVGIDDAFQRVSSNYLRRAVGGNLFADDKIRIILAQNGQPPFEGPPGPAHRPRHAEMIDALTQAGASVVALDTYPGEPSEWDAALANSIQRAEAAGTHVIIGTDGVKSSGEPETEIPETLKEALPDKIGNVKVGYTLAGFLPATKAVKLGNEIQTSDRQPWLYPSLVLQTFRYFKLPANARPADVSFDRERRMINLTADDKLIQSIPVNDDQMLYYFRLPTEDVLAGVRRTYQDVYADRNKPESLEEFRGKIVLIGYEVDEDVHYVNGVRKMPGVEIQACVASNIFQRVSLRRLSNGQNSLILLLMIGIGFALQTKLLQRFSIKLPFESSVLRRLITIPVPLLLVVLLYLTAIYWIYSRTNWEIDMTYHIAALFIAYWFGNYVQEQRNRVAVPAPKLEPARHEGVPADA